MNKILKLMITATFMVALMLSGASAFQAADPSSEQATETPEETVPEATEMNMGCQMGNMAELEERVTKLEDKMSKMEKMRENMGNMEGMKERMQERMGAMKEKMAEKEQAPDAEEQAPEAEVTPPSEN